MKRPNIIAVGIDTLRADHLSCYGYPLLTSPRIDTFANQGALIENFFCAGIPTYPSFTTFYTGQHPITHGIVAHGGKGQRLDEETPFLSKVLLDAGYTTCAIDNLNRARPWFMWGYEYYIDPSVRRTMLLGVTCEELNNRALPWVKAQADAKEPFFLFIHYWDPHWPYTPPKKYENLYYQGENPTDPNKHGLEEWWETPLGALAKNTWLRTENGLITDPEYVCARYDQEIRHLDDGLQELFTTLEDAGLTEDTLIVIFGDHGESLLGHRVFFDHHGLHDSVTHVPMILRWPGVIGEGQRFEQMFQHQDIAPTIIEAAGLKVPEKMEGISFWPLVTGKEEVAGREQIISVECTRMAKWGIRTKDHRFILARQQDFYGNPMKELYDLRSDPEEENNLVESQPELAAQMEATLENWIAERLKALGKEEDPLKEQGVSLGWDGM